MSMYRKDLSFVSPNMARFAAWELPLQSLTKKDLANLKEAYFIDRGLCPESKLA